MKKVALITGASRGIGAAVALALARRDFDTVLAVRSPAAATDAAKAIQLAGGRCTAVACDVANAQDVQAAVAQALSLHGRLDVVVNNAGQIDPIGHIGDTDPAQWARAIAVNLTGAYHVVHAALPALRETRGMVVNLSTGAAHTPREGWSAYCSAKAALAMFTRCIAHEHAADGIAAYGLQPGLVDTDMQVRIRGSGMNEISRIPRENLAPPSRCADLIAWLAVERPSDLIGQDLTVNDAALMARAGIA